ncbi:MAG TPA: hypothetical protein VL332_07610 [Candidatus Saccharimonadaceae bacterium]|jgi:hypothetical protein|nr:hypothetical protein [Candidatus Saccharimonadaceae bacterium]
MLRRLLQGFDARRQGATLTVLGLASLAARGLVFSALGLELLALAFWCWARAADDAVEQVRRWSWLRRPAQALWFAAGVHAIAASVPAWPGFAHMGAAALLPRLEAGGVVWAGLELLAALPLSRPYSDVSGPLLVMRPWLPTLLPAAGFAVLWRNADAWVPVPEIRRIAEALLLLTAVLSALRAFGRRQWIASLRWLTITDSALGALLVASAAVRPQVSLLLWLGACGGRAFMLAGELRGATSRRGTTLPRMWRAASWVGSAALSWPLLIRVGFGPGGGAHAVRFFLTAVPVTLTAWIAVRRIVKAPERRQMMRRDAAVTLSHFSALLTLVLGPLALLLGWWLGFEASWPGSVISLLPSALGGGAAFALPKRKRAAKHVVQPTAGAAIASESAPRPRDPLPRGFGALARGLARGTFRNVTALERWIVDALGRLATSVISPLRDLHTGDAQEYLLFLVGLSVLALVLPFLR